MKNVKAHLLAVAAASLLGIGGVISTNTQSVQPQTVSAASTGVITVNYVKGYSIAIWTSPTNGKYTGKKLKHGTSWKVYGSTTVNGAKWYSLGGNQWIAGKYTISGYPQVSQAASPVSTVNTYPWGQCTWYVKHVAPWVSNNWGNAGNWDTNAMRAGFLVNRKPAVGSVIVFQPGQIVGSWRADGAYGHVGYVTGYNARTNTVTFNQGGMGFSHPAGPNTQTIGGATSYTYIHR